MDIADDNSLLLISLLFINLYMKMFCNLEQNENQKALEKLYHLFSLWVFVTHMKQLFYNNEQCDNTCNCNLNVTNIFDINVFGIQFYKHMKPIS